MTGRNVSIEGDMSDALEHFAFQASMKRRLMKMMDEKRIKDSENSRKEAREKVLKKGKLGKFYGLPPQSIMDSYMPKSIVDTLTEKAQKEKEEKEKKEKKEKEEKEKKEVPNLQKSIAKDWGSFGQKIQEEFEEINRKHMLDQFGEESTTTAKPSSTTPNYDN